MATAGKPVNVKLAVIGIYFGTVPTGPPAAGASGIAASKYRNAPSASVPSTSSVKHLADQIQAMAAKGEILNCTQFQIDATRDTQPRIRRISATYTNSPSHDRMPGIYSLADHTPLGMQTFNPKLAWQCYRYTKDFVQVPAYGSGAKQSILDDITFNDGDLILFRCVLIATDHITFVPADDLSRKLIV
jgi:hypothetical protein